MIVSIINGENRLLYYLHRLFVSLFHLLALCSPSISLSLSVFVCAFFVSVRFFPSSSLSLLSCCIRFRTLDIEQRRTSTWKSYESKCFVSFILFSLMVQNKVLSGTMQLQHCLLFCDPQVNVAILLLSHSLSLSPSITPTKTVHSVPNSRFFVLIYHFAQWANNNNEIILSISKEDANYYVSQLEKKSYFS